MSVPYQIHVEIEQKILEKMADEREREFCSPIRVNELRRELIAAVRLEFPDSKSLMQTQMVDLIKKLRNDELGIDLYRLNCLHSAFEQAADDQKIPPRFRMAQVYLPLFSDKAFTNSSLISEVFERASFVFSVHAQQSGIPTFKYPSMVTRVRRWFLNSKEKQEIPGFHSKEWAVKFIADFTKMIARFIRVLFRHVSLWDQLEEYGLEMEPLAVKVVFRKTQIFYENLLLNCEDVVGKNLKDWKTICANTNLSSLELKEAILADDILSNSESPQRLLKKVSDFTGTLVFLLSEQSVQPSYRLVNFCTSFGLLGWKIGGLGMIDHPVNIELSKHIAINLSKELALFCLALNNAGLMTNNRQLSYLCHHIRVFVNSAKVATQMKGVGPAENILG